MKAMILAAGRGTRLGALTAQKPKALVEVGGVPLLEIVLARLRDAGVNEVIINLHHFASQIETFLAARKNFGLRIVFSREPQLLDTGGGLKQAAGFFAGVDPFFVHNVDVLSDIDLPALRRAHVESGALATLAAMERDTTRPLLFDADSRLCGRMDSAGAHVVRRGREPLQRLGFCGIQVISPPLLSMLTESGAFSIIASYLRLAAEDHAIFCHRVDGARWRDAGRPENLGAL